ncbi:MAG: DUF4838 domain-containing protein [Isosphaeraceae bacterium]
MGALSVARFSSGVRGNAMLDRRSFLIANLVAVVPGPLPRVEEAKSPGLATRGVVLAPEDLSPGDWPERAARAGLTTIGIHHQNSPRAVISWIESDTGRRFLEACGRLELEVEYELHAMRELLPRALFEKNPEFFRLDQNGDRNPDANCCAHSERALGVIAENAVSIARVLRPTTGRYFYWGDDGQPWCCCRNCKGLSPSEQALRIENRIVRALRAVDPRARLAHLAYTNTLKPPKAVKPDRGIFLEYAPIRRRYDLPYAKQTARDEPDPLSALDANLEVFGAETAQVLEYWLDVSRFSGWKRPAVKLPWRPDVLEADLATYRSRGIRHITSFAVFVDADYLRRYGEPGFIAEYGAVLARSASRR